jgi:hypothetical protein
MSNGLLKAVSLLRKMAEKNSLPIDKVAGVLEMEWEDIKSEQAERRSSPEEKEAMSKIEELFGDRPDDLAELSPKEIAQKIGVRPNQGNRSRIRHHVKRLLELTYQKKAAAE